MEWGGGGKGGEGRGGDGSCDAMVFQGKNFFLWVRAGGGFVGGLLEGRKKAETRLIRGGGGGEGLGLGGGVHRCTFLTVRGDTG